MLVRLMYVSQTIQTIDTDRVSTILTQARDNNPPHGITGVLCYSDKVFLQVLEGGREVINQLFRNIMKDNRHDAVTLLLYEEIQERRYACWTMGQANLGKINAHLLLKYFEQATLNPSTMSGQSSLDFIDELMVNAVVVGKVSG